jgi:hypothetical protein
MKERYDRILRKRRSLLPDDEIIWERACAKGLHKTLKVIMSTDCNRWIATTAPSLFPH